MPNVVGAKKYSACSKVRLSSPYFNFHLFAHHFVFLFFIEVWFLNKEKVKHILIVHYCIIPSSQITKPLNEHFSCLDPILISF